MRAGPVGFFESRTAITPGKLSATSTQLPEDPDRVLLRHCARDRSMPRLVLYVARSADRIHLSVFMWANLEEACDMPIGSPSELFERFIRWTH
jgi:hypothetical protein